MEKESASLYDCHVNTNEETDRFVGIRSDGERIKICFPLGYNLGKTETEKITDIRLLIRVLSRFSSSKEKLIPMSLARKTEEVNFPIQAYMTILNEYYSRGYYTENERIFTTNGHGSTSWARTIKTQKAYLQDDSFIYLNRVSHKSSVDSANYVTKINEFCVYEAYGKIGFLFPTSNIKRPSISFDEKRFISVLRQKLHGENNDKNKTLFSSMIDMIQYLGRKGHQERFFFGTDYFEYVWEKLIDFNFGENNKRNYFPKTSWYLVDEGNRKKSALEPDTVMKKDNKIFILDAKYYRYGVSKETAELPGSPSINKQITYGEYASKFHSDVYNVFLMPFNKNGHAFYTEENMLYIGEARGDWKKSQNPYERVLGILLDVKWMMQRTVKHNEQDISQLAQLVESTIHNTNVPV